MKHMCIVQQCINWIDLKWLICNRARELRDFMWHIDGHACHYNM